MTGFFSNEPSLARKLGAQPHQPIHAFPEGTVGRIVGAAGHVADDRRVAPLTGRACIAWSVRITGAEAREGAVPLIEAHEAAPFTVRDETGQALIRTAGLSLLLPFDVNEALGIAGKVPPRLVRFLRERAGKALPVKLDWRLSWQEGLLTDGQRVAIVGRGRREADPEGAEGSYRQAATRLVMMRAGENEELFASTFAGSLGTRA